MKTLIFLFLLPFGLMAQPTHRTVIVPVKPIEKPKTQREIIIAHVADVKAQLVEQQKEMQNIVLLPNEHGGTIHDANRDEFDEQKVKQDAKIKSIQEGLKAKALKTKPIIHHNR